MYSMHSTFISDCKPCEKVNKRTETTPVPLIIWKCLLIMQNFYPIWLRNRWTSFWSSIVWMHVPPSIQPNGKSGTRGQSAARPAAKDSRSGQESAKRRTAKGKGGLSRPVAWDPTRSSKSAKSSAGVSAHPPMKPLKPKEEAALWWPPGLGGLQTFLWKAQRFLDSPGANPRILKWGLV